MSEIQENQEITGVGFAIAAFNDEDAGNQVLKAMKQAKKDKQFYYEAAAVIRKEADGDMHYHETGDMSTGKGAGIGALVGGIVGVLGGPAGIAAGAGVGALIGGVAAHGDAGFSDKSLKQLGTALKPGTSAVVVITSKEFLKAFRKEVPKEDVWSLVSAISARVSPRLDEGKDIMLGIALTEDGFAVGELSANDEVAEIIGMAATNEAVAVGQAVVTEDAAGYQVGVATEDGIVTETAVATEDAAAVIDTVTTEEGTEVAAAAIAADDTDDTEEADDAEEADNTGEAEEADDTAAE